MTTATVGIVVAAVTEVVTASAVTNTLISILVFLGLPALLTNFVVVAHKFDKILHFLANYSSTILRIIWYASRGHITPHTMDNLYKHISISLTIDALIFSLWIDVLESLQSPKVIEMFPRRLNNTLRTIAQKMMQQQQSLE